ncbi:MAG TPA: hypothetical protein VLG12_07260 [Candidatus Saccharimonadales bacterium]|nr:hypothetical protein [Candidatus Saccharimonadales bacterium]
MKKKFIITWRIAVVLFAAVLFVQLFTALGTPTTSQRVGRVLIPQMYLTSTTTTNQLTYK